MISAILTYGYIISVFVVGARTARKYNPIKSLITGLIWPIMIAVWLLHEITDRIIARMWG